MKKIAGVRGAYRMLGREGENKNCLLGWVWVHPKRPERPHPELVHRRLLVHSS
jgi:hypothetical protein